MLRRSLLAALPTMLGALPALAQGRGGPAPLRPFEPPTIGIMGGGIDSTLTRIATDLTSVIPVDTVRVVPVIGRGPLQNIGDLIRLPNVDLALVSVDALAYASQRRLYPQLDKIAYIAKLFESDVHVCARPEIRSLNDLEGKAVNIDVAGSGTDLTARAVFAALEIKPDFRNEEPTIAQTKLRNGALAANVYLEGKPVPLFVNTPPGTGLHFLTVLSNPMLDQAYVPGGEFTHEDYPTLIAPDEFVETLGVSVVMAAFNWPPNTVRNRNLTVFTQQFFQHFPELLTPPHHPKWHDVNLAADLPGWPRFPPATAQLASVVAGSTEAAHTRFIAQFNAWLEQNGGASMTAAQRQAMLQAFASILVGKP